MPRYFFHFASRDEFIADYEGVILEDVKAAHDHALRLIAETVGCMPDEDFRHWRVEIADETQLVVLTVLFPSVPTAASLLIRRREHSPFDTVDVPTDHRAMVATVAARTTASRFTPRTSRSPGKDIG